MNARHIDPGDFLPLTPAVFHVLLALGDGERDGGVPCRDLSRPNPALWPVPRERPDAARHLDVGRPRMQTSSDPRLRARDNDVALRDEEVVKHRADDGPTCESKQVQRPKFIPSLAWRVRPFASCLGTMTLRRPARPCRQPSRPANRSSLRRDPSAYRSIVVRRVRRVAGIDHLHLAEPVLRGDGGCAPVLSRSQHPQLNLCSRLR